MKKLFLLFAVVLLLLPPTFRAESKDRELRFYTEPAMYAANEEWLVYACELPDGMDDIHSKHAQEMYWYSRYGLGNLLFRSGMGVHMVNNPLFKKHAMEDKGKPWYSPKMPLMGQKKFLMFKIAQFKRRSGVDKLTNFMGGLNPPKGAFPIYLEFSSGVPTFVKEPQLTDFSTLRWDPKKMDRKMNPGAWGQSMMKQVLWARDFFTGTRTSKGVTYIGNSGDDGANGFRGAALIAMALTKSFALKSQLAFHAKTGKLGGVNPMTYNPMNGPVYYPHGYKVNLMKMHKKGMMMPPMVKGFKVTDKRSDLFDVASLLWAQSEFYFFTDPKVKDDYDLLFGDPKWNPRASDKDVMKALRAGKAIFPAKKPHMLSKGLTAVNFKNMMALHFLPKKGTLVDTWKPGKGKGSRLTTAKAGMAMVALANTYFRLHDVKKLKMGAKKILTAQANFLVNHQEKDGSIPNAFKIKNKVRAQGGAKTLIAQAFAIRGLIAAYRVTKNEKFLTAANRIYDYMEAELWSSTASVYRSQAGASTSKYDGYNYGAAIGALREIAITRSGMARAKVVARLDSFFENVANKNGLQISEITPTGEAIPSPQMAMKMKAKMMKLMKKNPAKARKMKMKMMDSDHDGVPKPKFVMGTKFGAAPVMAGWVKRATN